jgi:hypothetical protein
MWKPTSKGRIESHLLKEVTYACRRLPPRDDAVRREHLGHRVPDFHSRVKAVIRILEDDLHMPAVFLQRPTAKAQHIFALEENLATHGWAEAHYRAPNCRLPGTALAY